MSDAGAGGFVARTPDLALVSRALNAARRGTLKSVVIEGEPGRRQDRVPCPSYTAHIDLAPHTDQP
jgi:hypothetical protein